MQGDTVVPLVTSLEVTALWPTSMGFLCPQQLEQQLPASGMWPPSVPRERLKASKELSFFLFAMQTRVLTVRDPLLRGKIPEFCSLLWSEVLVCHLYREGSFQTLFKIFKIIIIPITGYDLHSPLYVPGTVLSAFCVWIYLTSTVSLWQRCYFDLL